MKLTDIRVQYIKNYIQMDSLKNKEGAETTQSTQDQITILHDKNKALEDKFNDLYKVYRELKEKDEAVDEEGE